MKIGILTYYSVHNHGAVLQANALKKVLEEMGHNCTFLKFDRDYSNLSIEQTKKYKYSAGSIIYYSKYLLKNGIGSFIYNIKKRQLLNRFRKKNLPIETKYQSFSGDVVVIGSDEVFSLEVGINPFLYGNGLSAKHIISYAGSFGPTNYEDVNSEIRKMISRGFHKMDAISVRDVNSMNLVKTISGLNAKIVCDPVILYGYKNEMLEFIPPIKDYLLIYSYDKNMNDESEYIYIKKYASKHNLKIVSVAYYHRWCKSINATPIELLGWIKNANAVITDTFHGSVMSIICNTPFLVKIRNNSNKLTFLLSEYNLDDCIINNFSDIELMLCKSINYKDINLKIEEYQKKSKDYLKDVLFYIGQ